VWCRAPACFPATHPLEHPSVEHADSGVDEHDAVAGAYEERAEGDLEHAVVGEELTMRRPVVVVEPAPGALAGAPPEGLRRDRTCDAVDDTIDLDVAHPHRPILPDAVNRDVPA
jgi:hypothetical protein